MTDYGLTPELIALVKKTEGWVPHPYICPAGYPTIGWGHRIPSLDHPNISVEEGEQLLMSDLRTKRDHALRLSPQLGAEPERRLAAIVDFCFNVGEGPKGYEGSTLRKCVNLKWWNTAADQMKKWVYARDPKRGNKKFKLQSLIDRRAICATWLEA